MCSCMNDVPPKFSRIFFSDGWYEIVSTLQKIPASFVILVSKLFITHQTERSWAILMLTLILMVEYLGHEKCEIFILFYKYIVDK